MFFSKKSIPLGSSPAARSCAVCNVTKISATTYIRIIEDLRNASLQPARTPGYLFMQPPRIFFHAQFTTAKYCRAITCVCFSLDIVMQVMHNMQPEPLGGPTAWELFG